MERLAAAGTIAVSRLEGAKKGNVVAGAVKGVTPLKEQ